MQNILGYRCVACKAEYGFKEAIYTCRTCGKNLQVVFDYKKIKKKWKKGELKKSTDWSIWRYSPLFPVRTKFYLPIVGWTPMYKADGLGKTIGLKNLYIKDDGRNPSASFKDRASAMVLARAMDAGIHLITGASTGNAGSSLACLAAGLGIKTVIFVPSTAPAAKLTQLLIFGSKLVAVKGTYDNAFDLCLKATEKFGWYNRNTGFNPFTREGKKSCSYEICEQLNWKAPDVVVVPTGDGNILSGIWKGFVDFYEMGFIDKLPKLIAVQAEHSNAVKLAWESNAEIRAVSGETVADSISVSVPRDGEAAVQAIRESKGAAVSVSDAEILEAIKTIARNTGVFAEPAASASYAGLRRAVEQKLVKENEKIVILLTGNGLKDVVSAMKVAGRPIEIEADPRELDKIAPTPSLPL